MGPEQDHAEVSCAPAILMLRFPRLRRFWLRFGRSIIAHGVAFLHDCIEEKFFRESASLSAGESFGDAPVAQAHERVAEVVRHLGADLGRSVGEHVRVVTEVRVRDLDDGVGSAGGRHLPRVAVREHPRVTWLEQRHSAARVDQLFGAGAGEHAQLHVGEGTGRGGRTVVEIVVAVYERKTRAAGMLAQRGEDADEDAAARAEPLRGRPGRAAELDPGEGPVLYLSNHQSFLDPVILGISTHKRAFFALARASHSAKEEINAFEKADPATEEQKKALRGLLEEIESIKRSTREVSASGLAGEMLKIDNQLADKLVKLAEKRKTIEQEGVDPTKGLKLSMLTEVEQRERDLATAQKVQKQKDHNREWLAEGRKFNDELATLQDETALIDLEGTTKEVAAMDAKLAEEKRNSAERIAAAIDSKKWSQAEIDVIRERETAKLADFTVSPKFGPMTL